MPCYYVVMTVRTSRILYSGDSVHAAAEQLVPGTVFASGWGVRRATELAFARMREARALYSHIYGRQSVGVSY